MKHYGFQIFALVALACSLVACGKGKGGPATLTVEELMKPETCKECHASHYRDWASSMHAYASKDPVFLAMNARGQEETGGELGDFCVKCHAPLAVAMGLTKNGMNLDDLPEETKGITCYFCHNVESIDETHDNALKLPANNPLQLAMDTTMRGGLGRPGYADSDPAAVNPGVHNVAYSPLMDGDDLKSAEMCGSCHDLVTPSGVHLERTYHEWQGSRFSDPANAEFNQNTCVDCHMISRGGVVADSKKVKQVPFRSRGVHSHLFPGVDVALTDFPDRDIQEQAITCDLSDAVVPYSMTVDPNGGVTVTYDAAGVGHYWPSGATQDRRAYLRIIGYDADGNVIHSIGDVAQDQSVMDAAANDPNMAVFRDTMFDADDNEVHMFWEVDHTADMPLVFTGSPRGTSFADHSRIFTYANFSAGQIPAQIEAQLFIRPMGREVLQELLDSGHLQDQGQDESIMDRIPTFPIGASRIVWDQERDGFGTVNSITLTKDSAQCRKDLRCQIEPDTCAAGN